MWRPTGNRRGGVQPAVRERGSSRGFSAHDASSASLSALGGPWLAACWAGHGAASGDDRTISFYHIHTKETLTDPLQEGRRVPPRGAQEDQLDHARLAQEPGDRDRSQDHRHHLGDARGAGLARARPHHLRLSLARYQRNAAQDGRRTGEPEPAHHRQGHRHLVSRTCRRRQMRYSASCASAAASATIRPPAFPSCTSTRAACATGRACRATSSPSSSRPVIRSTSPPTADRSRRPTCARRASAARMSLSRSRNSMLSRQRRRGNSSCVFDGSGAKPAPRPQKAFDSKMAVGAPTAEDGRRSRRRQRCRRSSRRSSSPSPSPSTGRRASPRPCLPPIARASTCWCRWPRSSRAACRKAAAPQLRWCFRQRSADQAAPRSSPMIPTPQAASRS